MEGGFLRRYLITNALMAIAVLALALFSAARGDRAGAVVLVVGTLVAIWWGWPTRGPHVDEAKAKEAMEVGDVIVYWRPGCVHCARLAITSRLTRWPEDGPRRFRVNVWKDPDAATTVRLARGGFETVPTVMADDETLIVPTPAGIKAGRRLGGPRP